MEEDEGNVKVNTVPMDPENPPNNAYLTGWKLRAVTLSLMLGMFLVGVDSSIIGVATPHITTAFHSMDDIAWYGSGYMLPHTVLQPTMGTIYKYFNVTWVYLASVLVFEIGSALCAAAPTSTAFIIGRVIAGCGAAGILQGTLSIVGQSVPKKKVPLYYGYVLSVQGISACSAPIFGGTFSDKISWRWCFWINLPIGAVSLLVVPFLIKPSHVNEVERRLPVLVRLKRIDWLGTALFMGAFTCLFLALQWGGQTKPWNDSVVISLFVGAGLILALFVYTQKYTGELSLLPRRILKQRTVLFATIYLVLFGLQMAVYLYYIPIYFQAVRGTSATASGVRMISLDAARILFIIISGGLVTQFGHYMPYMLAGTMINALGAGFMTTLNINTSTGLAIAFMFIVGTGSGLGGNIPFSSLQAVLNEEDMPIGNGLTVFGLQLGTSLAFAISQTVFLTRVFDVVKNNPLTAAVSRPSLIAAGASHLDRLVKSPAALRILREAYSSGIRDTMIVALVAICLCHLCLPGMEWLKLVGENEKNDSGSGSEEDEIALKGGKYGESRQTLQSVTPSMAPSERSLDEINFGVWRKDEFIRYA